MSGVFLCKIIPTGVDSNDSVPLGRKPAKYQPALIHIQRAKTQGLIETNWISDHRFFHFQYGDTIACVQGAVLVLIQSIQRGFVLQPGIPYGNASSLKTVLEINKETTKILPHLGVHITKDIGNINAAGGGRVR